MRIGLDGIPLSQPRTGIGTYTFELARALAATAPQDEYELIAALPFDQSVSSDTRPANLKLIELRPQANRLWWTLGLPSYLRRNALHLFHGTNYEVPVRGHF